MKRKRKPKTDGMQQTADAPAKINLTLEILGKREDGYHDLKTIYHAIRLCDTLVFDWTQNQYSFSCDNPSVPTDGNLVTKALQLVERELGESIPVGIALTKRIPMGAGLGGGSSDAAAVLRITGEHFGIPEEKLVCMACKLGADVPFFLQRGTMFGTGKGEKLETLPTLPSFPIVLVKPPFSISTAFAYGKVTRYGTGEKSKRAANALRNGETQEVLKNLANDFETFLFPLYPELQTIKETLLDHGAIAAQITGSGSALFAIAPDQEKAKEIAASVQSLGRVWITKT